MRGLSDLLEGRAETDSQWLLALMNDVHTRIGEAPVYIAENGKVFVHPQLARELEKPGNEGLSDRLIGAGNLSRARRSADKTSEDAERPQGA